jgi:hypothetical protein
MATGASAVFAGLQLVDQQQWAALPLALFLATGLSDFVQRFHTQLPRSVEQVMTAWRQRRMFALHLVLVMLVGLLGGHSLALVGFRPAGVDPVADEEERQRGHAQAAADAFPRQAPMLHRELDTVAGLIANHSFRIAEDRLGRVLMILRPVQRSYAGGYADVLDVQRHLDETRTMLVTTRQAVDVQQARGRIVVAAQKLDAVDALLDRGHLQDATRAWVTADKALTDLHAPAALGAEEAALRHRADALRLQIRAGGRAPPPSNAKADGAHGKRKKRLYTSADP